MSAVPIAFRVVIYAHHPASRAPPPPAYPAPPASHPPPT